MSALQEQILNALINNIDAVRIPYDEETKKARTRSVFVGKKWLEIGYNPKDIWSAPRLHRIDAERVEHPTQKPLEIIDRMVLASSPPQGLVLDPFGGSGTTAVSCLRHNRRYIIFEINEKYCHLAQQRIVQEIENGDLFNKSMNSFQEVEQLPLDSEKKRYRQASLIE